MTNPNDPCFPAPELAIAKGVDQEKILQLGATLGMSKRELFAAMAMGALIEGSLASGNGIMNKLNVSEGALNYADALIAELNKSGEK